MTPTTTPEIIEHHPAPPTRPARIGLGLASLLVGTVAMIGALIPVLDYVSGVVALAGLVLGVVAMCMAGQRLDLALSGVIVSAAALVLSVVLAIGYTIGLALVADASITRAVEDSTREIGVVYTVTGTSDDATIVYTRADGVTHTLVRQALPFTDEETVVAHDDFDSDDYVLTASNGSVDGDISCSVVIDGTVYAEETAIDPYAAVSCGSAE